MLSRTGIKDLHCFDVGPVFAFVSDKAEWYNQNVNGKRGGIFLIFFPLSMAYQQMMCHCGGLLPSLVNAGWTKMSSMP